MSYFKRPFELRNIKDNPDGYQVQFIVEGKSHSAFDKDLEKAKKIRDRMEKNLKIIRNGAFKQKPGMYKLSFIPGTDKPMPPGISLRIYNRQGSETYEIIVNWRDHTGKARVKTFYGCSETCYKLTKMRAAYKSALSFRKAYEQAVLDNTLAELDPTSFIRLAANRKVKVTKEERKSTSVKNLRSKTRARRR